MLRINCPNLALAVNQLAKIQAPTLLGFANNDPMDATTTGRRMADTMPVANLHIDGGHAPWLHHTDQIAARLTTFLGHISPSAGD
jgi:pimeloyl-ACP methyl ester carboxylesterase